MQEAVREQIAAQEKSVAARDAEAKATQGLANAFGTENEQRAAHAAATAASAVETEKLTALRLTELATMQAELKSLKEEAAQFAVVDEAKTKQMAELEKQIALRQQDADKAVAQAEARAMGNEVAVIASKIRQKEIEIKIIEATVQAQIAEAEGSMAVARAKMTEMEAAGKLDAVNRAELESTIKIV